jgi:hypothetical protein
MTSTFSILGRSPTVTGDNYEQVWLACSRLLVAEMDCFEQRPPSTWKSPDDDPCMVARSSAMSCIDKTQNWDIWDKLLSCRSNQMAMAHYKQTHPEAPDPISCHELAADMHLYRRRFFENIVSPPVAEWFKVAGTQNLQFLPLRVPFFFFPSFNSYQYRRSNYKNDSIDAAKQKCLKVKLAYIECAQNEGDQSIPCLELFTDHNNVC